MKLKNKMIVLLLITFAILLVVPSMVNAAESTYVDTAQGITWSYEVNAGGNIINLKCTTTSKIGEVTIPSEIEGKTVVSIGNVKNDYSTYSGAFENCAGITSVTIPNTITTIGYEAFKGCTGLKNVILPNSVTTIGGYAFADCSGMTEIQLSSSLTTVGTWAFSHCTGLKNISIPSSVSVIEGSAFRGCTGMTNLIIPGSVTTIKDNAFRGCTGLKSVSLSNNLASIDEGVFAECSGLTEIKLPESVTTIKGGGTYSGNGAFHNCSGLKKILIPDSVASIVGPAFKNCNNLTIYGNEGQSSHTYAQENNINFKLISEWDNINGGDDVSGPQVEKIRVTRACLDKLEIDDGMWMFPTGKRVVINVYFSEVVHGDTAPTLTIRCGQGENIELTNGTISSKHVIYEYTIKEGDIGIISTVNLSGGNLVDAEGNSAKLTCPGLVIEAWTSVVGDVTDEYIYANGTVSNPEDNEDNQTGEWTDFSKAKFELKKNGTSGAILEITGVTPKDESNYYLFITSNSSKLNVTSNDENKIYLNYNKESKKFDYVDLARYIELNQDIYITILENQDYKDEKIVLTGKKLERYAEPKYSDAFFATFMTNTTDQIVTTFTHDSDNNRKIQIKIGKITDLSILSKIKNQDASGFASLLTFAKSNKGMYDKMVDATKNDYAISYDAGTGTNTGYSVIDLEGLQDEAYYFLYVKTYDEDGKYISNEAVTLAQANVLEDGYWSLFFYGNDDFEWADFGDVEEDNTKAPIELPATGKFTLISILAVTAIAGAVSFIKSKKYKGI